MERFFELLPDINASFNGASAVCLITGFIAVKNGRVGVHKAAMLSAFTFSALFLACYLTKHFTVGAVGFQGPDSVRPVYLVILISHMLLAVPVVPLSITLIVLGILGRIDRHRRIARWTLPIWLYVSVTGVVVYIMLYRIWG